MSHRSRALERAAELLETFVSSANARHRFLMLIAEFDRREGWSVQGPDSRRVHRPQAMKPVSVTSSR